MEVLKSPFEGCEIQNLKEIKREDFLIKFIAVQTEHLFIADKQERFISKLLSRFFREKKRIPP